MKGALSPTFVAATTYTTAASFTVAVGKAHSCALRSDNRVVCWGRNSNGQLGVSGNKTSVGSAAGQMGPMLQPVEPGDGEFAPLRGKVGGWKGVRIHHGDARRPRLESIKLLSSEYLTFENRIHWPLSLLDMYYISPAGYTKVVVAVYVGGYHSCAVRRDQQAFCWGLNANGQLGIGSTVDSSQNRQTVDLGG